MKPKKSSLFKPETIADIVQYCTNEEGIAECFSRT